MNSQSESRFKKWRGRAPVPKPSSEFTLWNKKCKDCGDTVDPKEITCELCKTINAGLRNLKDGN